MIVVFQGGHVSLYKPDILSVSCVCVHKFVCVRVHVCVCGMCGVCVCVCPHVCVCTYV